jgi:hypothetical protein
MREDECGERDYIQCALEQLLMVIWDFKFFDEYLCKIKASHCLCARISIHRFFHTRRLFLSFSLSQGINSSILGLHLNILPLLNHRAITTLRISASVPMGILNPSHHRLIPMSSHAVRSEGMFLRRLVIDKQLSMLSIALGFVPRCSDDAEPAAPAALRFAEYDVDLLE